MVEGPRCRTFLRTSGSDHSVDVVVLGRDVITQVVHDLIILILILWEQLILVVRCGKLDPTQDEMMLRVASNMLIVAMEYPAMPEHRDDDDDEVASLPSD